MIHKEIPGKNVAVALHKMQRLENYEGEMGIGMEVQEIRNRGRPERKCFGQSER